MLIGWEMKEKTGRLHDDGIDRMKTPIDKVARSNQDETNVRMCIIVRREKIKFVFK